MERFQYNSKQSQYENDVRPYAHSGNFALSKFLEDVVFSWMTENSSILLLKETLPLPSRAHSQLDLGAWKYSLLFESFSSWSLLKPLDRINI